MRTTASRGRSIRSNSKAIRASSRPGPSTRPTKTGQQGAGSRGVPAARARAEARPQVSFSPPGRTEPSECRFLRFSSLFNWGPPAVPNCSLGKPPPLPLSIELGEPGYVRRLVGIWLLDAEPRVDDLACRRGLRSLEAHHEH